MLAKTKTECVKKLKELQTEYTVEPRFFRPKSDMCFGAWLNYWYENHCKPTIRPTTQKGYEALLSCHAIPQLGLIPLNKLTQGDCQHFLNEMKTNGRKFHRDTKGSAMSERSVRLCHLLLRMSMERAVKDGLIKKNPILGCKLPQSEHKEMKVLSTEEIQRFLIQAKEEGLYELFLLELTTGLRRGEICALQWNDLNFNTGELQIKRQIHRVKGELVVSEPKTKASNRSIILPSPVLAVLNDYKNEINSVWIFPSPVNENSPRDPAAVRKRLTTILERADCKHVRFQDLRHTFATTSLEHGMDIKTLSTIIGHVYSKTALNIYTHITDEMQENAAISIDRRIAKNKVPTRTKDETPPSLQAFQPLKPAHRRLCTGYVKQIKENLWEGRYSPRLPGGGRLTRNVYAHSEEECETMLSDTIREVNVELAELRGQATA